MDDTKKMLRTIINNQSVMKGELIKKIDDIDKKLSGRVDSLEKKIDAGFSKVDSRLDKIGKAVAYLEDDAPTREEFDKLDKRVDGLEQKFATT
jgi:tetrahydromethanopterin S-methyltransferase subunit G